MALLLLLRNQLANHDTAGFSSEAVYNAFINPGNQLQLLQNSEHVLNWRPQIADDPKNEVFPAVLEMETSPFRHGPPGCEDVIRVLFGKLGNGVLGEMIGVLKGDEQVSVGVMSDGQVSVGVMSDEQVSVGVVSDGQVSVGVVSDGQEAKLVEADLYVLGQFIEEMRADKEEHPIVCVRRYYQA